VNKVDKIGMRRPAAGALLDVIQEFNKLRFRDLPAGRERANLI